MKNIAYNLIQFWIRTSLHLYFGKIKIKGLENVPLNKPVMFLPNHQNALLDPLLIAVDCNRKPYFLTRSDVFKSPVFNKLFALVRMIPIYRIRDGRATLKHNEAIFERCAALLIKSKALLMFPEANHNLDRRVRPLSKGFTRILFRALSENFKLDIQLVPVGLNYLSATNFTDEVAIYFGEPIALQGLIILNDEKASVDNIKEKVAQSLKRLTTHIPEEKYNEVKYKLDAANVNYLNPIEINKFIADEKYLHETSNSKSKNSIFKKFIYPLFVILNLPVILLWRLWLKPKVWEPEFTDTLRFALSLFVFPMYYVLLIVIFTFYLSWSIALLVSLSILLFNWVYVKLS